MHIINVVNQTGIFFSIFKYSTIIPIRKAKDKLSVNNYRSTSLPKEIIKLTQRRLKLIITQFINKYKTLIIYIIRLKLSPHISFLEPKICNLT